MASVPEQPKLEENGRVLTQVDPRSVRRIHLLGIGGTGMGSFAGLLKAAYAHWVDLADASPVGQPITVHGWSDIVDVATITEPEHVDALLLDAGIVRNRAKIEAAIVNARAVQQICAEHGSFANFVWSFVDHVPLQNDWASYKDAPASTGVSDALSKALKRYGCKFVGTTICYAFMQAVGMVNDHEAGCASRARCAALSKKARKRATA